MITNSKNNKIFNNFPGTEKANSFIVIQNAVIQRAVRKESFNKTYDSLFLFLPERNRRAGEIRQSEMPKSHARSHCDPVCHFSNFQSVWNSLIKISGLPFLRLIELVNSLSVVDLAAGS